MSTAGRAGITIMAVIIYITAARMWNKDLKVSDNTGSIVTGVIATLMLLTGLFG